MTEQQFHHTRSDKGIKRGPRIKRHEVENAARQRARSDRGTFLTEYTPEKRQEAITDALRSLIRGETVLDVATRHNIPRSTLESWLIASNDASEARSLFYAGQIAECMEGMRSASDPLAHAQARDLRRAWAETAAVRDRNFMQKQEIRMEIDHKFIVDSALTDRMLELAKRIRGDAAPQLTQGIIDVEPKEVK